MLNQGIAIAAGRSRYRRQLTGVRLSMGHISFWVAAIVAPFLSIVVNGVLRICLGKPQSAAADFILTIIVFDVVVISQSEDFKKFIMPAMRGDIGSIFACLILINLCMWFVAIFKIEEKWISFMIARAAPIALASRDPYWVLW
ncbi:hypothetical protein MMSR116_31560 [Methylobacterium mesophilicum SR1.6/6]|uniref:Uncharacterized protein n=1 Tax=Methylobacterium mesophilicum SR1.6/6 TaxID=908290 RepID=A0A6B9FX26_9HYPH|nr:hypothetical protein [Methylobacterium mesophilicum]QGY05926.1 hypothetical protein MMSR116_31560 [Methylobacterium mesophilicum SR1.6/6]